MPRVSIIMATYNCSKTLDNCITSILKQTYTDWEFIICDDCSTDNTFNLLLQYSHDYPEKFIILKNNSNSKLAFSLNRCLEVSGGEYIARMDGDDESLPDRLEKQVAFLDTHLDISVVGTAMIPFDENGDRPIRYPVEIPKPKDMLNRSPIFHATIMMRKSAYIEIGGYLVSKRTERAQDYDMWFRFFEKGLNAYNLQEGLYRVLEDDGAIKRRTMKTRCYEAKTKVLGYKRLHFPWYLYPCAFKPIIVALVPVRLIQRYHIVTDKKSKKQNHLKNR